LSTLVSTGETVISSQESIQSETSEKDKEKEKDSKDKDKEKEKEKKSKKKDKEKDAEKEKKKPEDEAPVNLETVDMSKLEWEQCNLIEVAEKYLDPSRYKPSRKYGCTVRQLVEQSSYAVRAKAKNLSGWGDFCSPMPFTTQKLIIDSKILKPNEKKQMLKWLPKVDRNKKWKLMYRASKHGFGSSQFHAKVDNKSGTTVSIIQSTMNHVFGGYTTIAWTSSGNYASDNNSWIFLVRAGKNITPKKGKWKVTQTQYSVYHSSGNGPTFGGGHDFCVTNAANTNTSSYANAGHSYACPKNNNLLAGQYNFSVKDMETYMLVK